MDQHHDLIRDIPLLARLPDGDLSALASRGRVRSYRSGDAIFREGEPGDSLHMVIEGQVRIVVLSAVGEEVTVTYLGPGECVGDLALLDGRPRSASALASQATKTLVVTRGDFRRWLRERPQAAFALLETLSLRVRRTDEALADLALLDLPSRLAKRLLSLSGARQPAKGGAPAKLRITQAEMASMMGVSRESVNKQLNAFAREGWVSLGRGSVTVKDAKALRDLA